MREFDDFMEIVRKIRRNCPWDSVQTHESLKKYLDYFYRELYDRNSGTVYNDMQRNNDWHRLYNYAWAATLQTEVYKWSVNPVYLEDAVKTYLKFYQEGGQNFIR